MNRIIRKILGIVLGVSVAFSGVTLVKPQQAHAYSSSVATRIINTGRHYLGTPYRFGARAGQTRTFDCSSFTQYVYKRNGIYLPRTSRSQARTGTYVSRSHLKKGDLVFFYTRASGKGHVGHVAIYAGNGKILQTYGKPGVTYSNLNSPYWRSHYITARRVIR